MLEKLMQSIFHRVAALLSAKFTGEINIRITLNQGGVRDVKLSQEERLTLT